MGGWKASGSYQIAMTVDLCVALIAIGCTLTKHILLCSEWQTPVDAELIAYATFTVVVSNLTWITYALLSYASLSGLLPLHFGAIAIFVRMLFHLFAKFSLFLMLLTRFHAGFRGLLFSFSNSSIYWLTFCVIMQMAMMCLLAVFFQLFDRDVPFVYTLIFLMYDVFFLTLAVLLFNKAVRDTLRNVADALNAGELYMLLSPVKCTLLCYVMLASALISLTFFAATGTALFLPVDAIIDCVCVVLMTKPWSKLFVAGCVPMLRRMANVSCLPCGGPEAERLINLLVVNAQTAAMHSATALSLDIAETQASTIATVLPQSQAPALATVQSTEDSSSVR